MSLSLSQRPQRSSRLQFISLPVSHDNFLLSSTSPESLQESLEAPGYHVTRTPDPALVRDVLVGSWRFLWVLLRSIGFL